MAEQGFEIQHMSAETFNDITFSATRDSNMNPHLPVPVWLKDVDVNDSSQTHYPDTSEIVAWRSNDK
eukprot:11279320-Karenia_brevis.AAC.1